MRDADGSRWAALLFPLVLEINFHCCMKDLFLAENLILSCSSFFSRSCTIFGRSWTDFTSIQPAPLLLCPQCHLFLELLLNFYTELHLKLEVSVVFSFHLVPQIFFFLKHSKISEQVCFLCADMSLAECCSETFCMSSIFLKRISTSRHFSYLDLDPQQFFSPELFVQILQYLFGCGKISSKDHEFCPFASLNCESPSTVVGLALWLVASALWSSFTNIFINMASWSLLPSSIRALLYSLSSAVSSLRASISLERSLIVDVTHVRVQMLGLKFLHYSSVITSDRTLEHQCCSSEISWMTSKIHILSSPVGFSSETENKGT